MAESTEFEKATDCQFKESDIERAKAMVGRWAPSANREHLTTANHDAMRNFARGYGDDNPLFCTEEYGTTTRWGGQIAPCLLYTSDAADERSSVDLGGRRIIKKKKNEQLSLLHVSNVGIQIHVIHPSKSIMNKQSTK